MSTGPAKGTALRTHQDYVKLVPGTPRNISAGEIHAGSIFDSSHIPKIRELLRTTLSIDEIAEHFGVSRRTLASFIRRRRICDIAERRRFLGIQKSQSKGAIE